MAASEKTAEFFTFFTIEKMRKIIIFGVKKTLNETSFSDFLLHKIIYLEPTINGGKFLMAIRVRIIRCIKCYGGLR